MRKINQWVKRHLVLVIMLVVWVVMALIDTVSGTSIAYYGGYILGIWLVIRGIQWVMGKSNKKKV